MKHRQNQPLVDPLTSGRPCPCLVATDSGGTVKLFGHPVGDADSLARFKCEKAQSIWNHCISGMENKNSLKPPQIQALVSKVLGHNYSTSKLNPEKLVVHEDCSISLEPTYLWGSRWIGWPWSFRLALPPKPVTFHFDHSLEKYETSYKL